MIFFLGTETLHLKSNLYQWGLCFKSNCLPTRCIAHTIPWHARGALIRLWLPVPHAAPNIGSKEAGLWRSTYKASTSVLVSLRAKN